MYQPKHAVFLPAISTFYNTTVGKQRTVSDYVDPKRIPSTLQNGVEGINFLDPKQSVFYYPWGLHSAGHADLDLTKVVPKENMIRERPRNGDSFMLGDSGGFQIGKGVWEGEWRDPNGPEVKAKMADCIAKGIELVPLLDEKGNPKLDKKGNPKTIKVDHVKIYQAQLDAAQLKRSQVLTWMDALMDYGMILDIPAWVARDPKGRKATGISTYQEAVNATKYNNDYFIKHRNGNCKFLNVLQGETHADAEDWYQQMKEYCDPKLYPDNHFNGWAMGGQNMCDIHLVLKRLVALRFDGLLEEGKHDWMHFLGTSKLEWAVLLTDLQNAVRKYHNKNFTISFDCASPFLANANGLIYTYIRTEDKDKWIYKMESSIDDRKFSNDTRSLRDGLMQEGIVADFEDSPISKILQVKDICTYAPGAANKVGNVSRTSWDSFSYALQMAHNVWMHVMAVQRANDHYNKNIMPAMLVDERFERIVFKDIVDSIFAINDRAKAEAEIEKWDKFYLRIIGQRGAVGKKTLNSKTGFNEIAEIIPPSNPVDIEEPKEREVLTTAASFNTMFSIEGNTPVDTVLIEDEYVFDQSKADKLDEETNV